MTQRVGMWALVGFLVAGCWALYAMVVPMYLGSIGPVEWALLSLTCPVAFAALKLHIALGLGWVLLANATTYALIGLIVESLLPAMKSARTT